MFRLFHKFYFFNSFACVVFQLFKRFSACVKSALALQFFIFVFLFCFINQFFFLNCLPVFFCDFLSFCLCCAKSVLTRPGVATHPTLPDLKEEVIIQVLYYFYISLFIYIFFYLSYILYYYCTYFIYYHISCVIIIWPPIPFSLT